MHNRSLAGDYVHRAEVRLLALDVLFGAGSWADVVRESQETLELALKGLLRACGIEPPRVHDVSDVLVAEQHRLPVALRPDLDRIARYSKALRRDRELAFYGAEDLTPSDFYSEADATAARDAARVVVALVKPHVPSAGGPAPAGGTAR